MNATPESREQLRESRKDRGFCSRIDLIAEIITSQGEEEEEEEEDEDPKEEGDEKEEEGEEDSEEGEVEKYYLG
jgi:hypothetical protein